METFKPGATYTTWEQFFEAFEKYRDETYQPLVKYSNRLTSAANEKIQPGRVKYPEQLQFTCYDFRCTHRGAFKSQAEAKKTRIVYCSRRKFFGKNKVEQPRLPPIDWDFVLEAKSEFDTVRGKRKGKDSLKSGCPAKVYASVDKLFQKVVVRKVVDEHNHEIGPELYASYPKQRLLPKEDEADLAELCKLKISTKALRQHVKEHYGRDLSSTDVRNIISRTRARDKEKSKPEEETVTMDSASLFIAVHAGAGSHSKENEPKYKAVCKAACQQAMALLKKNKTAMEAVTAAVVALENAECTNAGQGSNLTMEGKVECDASLMDGNSLFFGAVGALSGVKNPVRVAHRLAEEQKLGPLPCGRVRPSILVGVGAQDFCRDCDIHVNNNLISNSAFKTYHRYKRKCQQAEMSHRYAGLKKMKTELNDDIEDQAKSTSDATGSHEIVKGEDLVQDTVGAVCVDQDGNMAAAASSGGIWLKHSGRLGPAALYGAGCWAQNQVSDSKAGVAAVTSGCGEHLVQTLLAKTCSEAVRCTPELSNSMAPVFQENFLDSEFLRRTPEKFAGVLMLKSRSHEAGREVEVSWIHSTASMCLAFMDGIETSPTVLMSRLNGESVPGVSYTTGGHMTTCYHMEVATDSATEEILQEEKPSVINISTADGEVEEKTVVIA